MTLRSFSISTGLGGEGVGVAAEEIQSAGDFPGTPLLGALEHQVLDEVGDTVLAERLVPGAAAQPHTETDRAELGHLLGEKSHPAGENLFTDTPAHGGRLNPLLRLGSPAGEGVAPTC